SPQTSRQDFRQVLPQNLQLKQRYLELIERGPRSLAEGQELMDMGILVDGTRTKLLNHLAAHLVWFQGQSPEEAAEQLTTWAYSPQHDSKDIQSDLQNHTTKVADHIAR